MGDIAAAPADMIGHVGAEDRLHVKPEDRLERGKPGPFPDAMPRFAWKAGGGGTCYLLCVLPLPTKYNCIPHLEVGDAIGASTHKVILEKILEKAGGSPDGRLSLPFRANSLT
jgi:hypothetical protein